jgi:hypothetical protein
MSNVDDKIQEPENLSEYLVVAEQMISLPSRSKSTSSKQITGLFPKAPLTTFQKL